MKKKILRAALLLLFPILCAGTALQAQKHKEPDLTKPTADEKKKHTPKIKVPEEKGRTVTTEQITQSGTVIVTPVPKPRKVVVVPAAPPGPPPVPVPRKR